MTGSIELKVAEALQNDVGRGFVRVDSHARKTLGLTTGDIVEIKGKRATAAVVWQAHQEHEGIGLILMDGYIRQNAGVGIGDRVSVRKAEPKEAKKVVLAPTQPIRLSPGFDKYVKNRMIGRPLNKGDTVFIGVFGTSLPMVAVIVQPAGMVQIAEDTELTIKEEPVKELAKVSAISYEDIGGLQEEVKKIRDMVELPLRHPELFERLGIEPPKGVLIYGPPGCGKTLLAKAVANESDAHFISIGGPELISKFVGESEERLRQVFKEAEENAPSIIFMDEIDAIAPKREEVVGEVEKRMVAQLLSLMDGLKARGQVVVIAATNRQNAIDPALRRPGRFDREIEIGVPDRNARKEILQIHTRNMPIVDLAELQDELANLTHGFVGADLAALAKEAAMKTLRRYLPRIDLEKDIPPEILEEMKVTRDDFMNALREMQPSALREVFVEVPSVRWSDIGGLANVKRELQEAVELPLKNPKKFEDMGIRPARGILLVGPPGCGKTLMAKAVATESESNFISIKGPEVLSKFVGESEKVVREVFRKARLAAPCVVFIDEIDSIAMRRGTMDTTHVYDTLTNTLLTEMDGLQNMKGIVVLAASNRPELIDAALMRPGRFDRILSLPSPDEQARLDILKVHTKKMPVAEDVNLDELAAKTDGYTGADMEGVCREAGMNAIRESAGMVTAKHFEAALATVRPTISKQHLERIKKFVEGEWTMYR